MMRRTFACQRADVLAAIATACLLFTSAIPVSPLESQNRDSVQTRQRLERDIGRFQNRWRDQWQQSMIERGAGVFNFENRELIDFEFGNYTPNILRLVALSCYAEYAPFPVLYALPLNAFEKAAQERATPTEYSSVQPGTDGVLNLLLPTRVNARGNDLAVCPRWIPEDEGIPPDEGERIDLALSIKRRSDIMKRRAELLATLGKAADNAPHDGWITGQRVRFLIDNFELEPALQVATDCTSSREWCSALAGLVLTQTGEFARADSAFDYAYAAGIAPRKLVCADTTARPLFELNARLSQNSASCDQWQAITQTTWWLSDPLWSVPGNARRAEHYARRTMLTLRTVRDEDERYNWRKSAAGDALEETIMRYGWPSHTWWGGSLVDNLIAEYAGKRLRLQPEYPYTAKEYAPDRIALVPDFAAVESPFTAVDSHWQWDKPEDAIRERWFPTEHTVPTLQLARLPEGQRVVLRRDSSLQFGWVIDNAVTQLDSADVSVHRAVLMAGENAATTRAVADTVLPRGASLKLAGTFAPTPVVLSLEIPQRSWLEASHRRREGFIPPPALSQMSDTSVALSDLALVRLPAAGARPPDHPDSAIAQLFGSTVLPREMPLALYWESYGFALGDTIDVEIRIVRRDGSTVRSVIAALGLTDAQRDSVSIRWREPDPGRNSRELPGIRPTVARALALDIRNLVPGNYSFIIEMRKPQGGVARNERRVEITLN